jgi:hypothetical protein
MRMAIALIAGAALLSGGTAAQQAAQPDCQAIHFAKGASAAIITGTAPANTLERPAEPACYSLAVGEGQHANVKLLSGKNVVIAIPDVGDARDEFTFMTRDGTYLVMVAQLFRNIDPEPFRIRVAVLP